MLVRAIPLNCIYEFEDLILISNQASIFSLTFRAILIVFRPSWIKAVTATCPIDLTFQMYFNQHIYNHWTVGKNEWSNLCLTCLLRHLHSTPFQLRLPFHEICLLRFFRLTFILNCLLVCTLDLENWYYYALNVFCIWYALDKKRFSSQNPVCLYYVVFDKEETLYGMKM